jgi:hypothetical protein
MSELREGTFKAVLTDWGVTKSSKGTPGVLLTFAVDVDEDLAQGEKILYLSDAAKQNSIQTLYKLGFNGNLEDLPAGRSKNALTGGVEVRVVCKNETYEGETRCKIAFVNLPDEVHGLNKLDPKEGASLLAGLKADFLSYKPVGVGTKKGLKLD